MLQCQNTEPQTDAAQVRVTPQELAQATASLEARREVEARHLADTIALGEAVQALGLAATPEELFAEVQALRAKAQQAETINSAAPSAKAGVEPSTQNAAAKQAAAYICLVVCGFAPFFACLFLMKPPAQTWPAASATTPAALISAPATVSTSVRADVARIRELNPGLFQSLNLKEGQTAKCSINDIRALAQGANPASVWVAKKTGEFNWQLARQAGQMCVKCWVTPADAALIANGRSSATVGAYKSGDAVIPIKLPLAKFTNSTDLWTNNGAVSNVELN